MSRAERRQATNKPSKPFNWILWGTVSVLLLVIVGAVVYAQTRGTGVAYADYNFTDEKFKRPNAAVTFEEFSDFQCPACQATSTSIKAFRDTAPDSVLVLYRNYPLRSIHPYAQRAAEAAQCAKQQNRFWAYHDVLFDSTKITDRDLKLHAQGLGLDMDAWDKCMDSGAARAVIDADISEGNKRGVRGTPTLFVGNALYEGARSPAEYLRACLAKLG